MDTQFQNPVEEIKAVTGYAVEMTKLVPYAYASRILASDTTFAIVAQLLERGINDSFWSTVNKPTVGIGGPGVGVNTEVGADVGLEGRFIGYVATGGGKLRVYKDDQLYVEEDLSSVSVAPHQGAYVIQTRSKKFKISSALPINGADGHFKSVVSGMNNGLDPFVESLGMQGAKTEKQSNLATFIFLGVFVFVFIIIAILAAS